jgi:hypothetical protein
LKRSVDGEAGFYRLIVQIRWRILPPLTAKRAATPKLLFGADRITRSFTAENVLCAGYIGTSLMHAS